RLSPSGYPPAGAGTLAGATLPGTPPYLSDAYRRYHARTECRLAGYPSSRTTAVALRSSRSYNSHALSLCSRV
ncbi:hypothetical protein, partial [Pseudoscardovia radai]|uniref:hypothetical protein n=1 Tax=Pseudoscardovia radai TaxID=987066 RepID=UPI003993CAFA